VHRPAPIPSPDIVDHRHGRPSFAGGGIAPRPGRIVGGTVPCQGVRMCQCAKCANAHILPRARAHKCPRGRGCGRRHRLPRQG
jgi:hypothetical protein